MDSEDIEEKMNNEAIKLGKKLENAGHVCVVYLESYPMQIDYCGQEKCIKN